jgi:mRNA interferase YafQ
MMLLTLEPSSQYRKDRKLMKKQGKNLSLLDSVIKKLQKRELLEAKHRDHPLKGKYAGCRECHVAPDWLLIYKTDNRKLVLIANRTGSHSELF